jgi:hypothetical protein
VRPEKENRAKTVLGLCLDKDVERGISLFNQLLEEWSGQESRGEWIIKATMLALSVLFVLTGLILIPAWKFPKIYSIFAFLSLMAIGGLTFVFLLWRKGQYGGSEQYQRRDVRHVDEDGPIFRAVERFFEAFSRESGPQLYYRTRFGGKRYLKEEYFFGTRRWALWVSKLLTKKALKRAT